MAKRHKKKEYEVTLYSRRTPERDLTVKVRVAKPDLLRRNRLIRRILDESNILQTYRRDIKRLEYAKIPQRAIERRMRIARNRILVTRWTRYIPRLKICSRRRVRRAVLFATRQTGKGSGAKRKFTEYSKVRC